MTDLRADGISLKRPRTPEDDGTVQRSARHDEDEDDPEAARIFEQMDALQCQIADVRSPLVMRP